MLEFTVTPKPREQEEQDNRTESVVTTPESPPPSSPSEPTQSTPSFSDQIRQLRSQNTEYQMVEDVVEAVQSRDKSRFFTGRWNYLDIVTGTHAFLTEEGGPGHTVTSDIGGGIAQTPANVVRGVFNALNEGSHFAFEMAGHLNNMVDLGYIEFEGWKPRWRSGMPPTNVFVVPDAMVPSDSPHVTGQLMTGVTQFLTGYMLSGNMLREFRTAGGLAPRATTSAGRYADIALQGAMADAIFFDPYEGRLSDYLNEHPTLRNAVTEFLATDPDNPAAIERLKNAVEGAGIGFLADAFIGGLRYTMGRIRKDEKLMERGLEELNREIPEVAPTPTDAPRPGVQPSGEAPAGGQAAPAGNQGEWGVLPKDLAGAKPRYNMGNRGFGLEFESDFDKALFIVSQTKKSKRDASYREFLARHGFTDDEITFMARDVRERLKNMAREADGDTIVFPRTHFKDAPAGQGSREGVVTTPERRLIEVDDQGLADLVSARIREQGFGGGRNFTGIRTDLIENGDDILSIMNSLRVVYRDKMDEIRGPDHRSFEETRAKADELGDIIGADSNALLARMSHFQTSTNHLDAEILMYKDFLATVGDRVYHLAEAVADVNGGTGGFASRAELYEAFRHQYELMGQVQSMYKGVQTNVARALANMRQSARVRGAVEEGKISPEDMIRPETDRDLIKLATTIKATNGDLSKLAYATRGGFWNRFWDSFLEWRTNSLLSGLVTHQVNVSTSMAVATIVRPTEMFVSGALRAHTPQGRERMLESGMYIAGLFGSVSDAWRMAGASFRAGEGILDPAYQRIESFNRDAISARNWNIEDPDWGTFIDAFGEFGRLSNRLMQAEDEFVKQLVYRANLRKEAYLEALRKNEFGDHRKIAEYVEKRMKSEFDPETGMALNKRYLEQAREDTFQSNIRGTDTYWGKGGIGENFQNFVDAHPTGRVLAPFVRTPTNLLRWSWDRGPLPLIGRGRKEFQDAVRGLKGEEAKYEAYAKLVTGNMLVLGAAGLVYSGAMTGSGPMNGDMRRALQDTGVQFNAVRVIQEDGSAKYYPIQRFGPLADYFTLMADAFEIMPHLAEGDLEQLAGVLATGISMNLRNRTYFTGMGEFLDMMFSGDPAAIERFIARQAGTIVPNVFNQQMKDDEILRELRTVVDGFRGRVRGFSETLDPIRTLDGRVMARPPGITEDWMSPIFVSESEAGRVPMTQEWLQEVNDNFRHEVARQMMVTNSTIQRPREFQGMDIKTLSQFRSENWPYSAYDRVLHLSGVITLDGKTLDQALTNLINSHEYRNLLWDGTWGERGSRLDALGAVYRAYWNTAWQQVVNNERFYGPDGTPLKDARDLALIQRANNRINPDSGLRLTLPQ